MLSCAPSDGAVMPLRPRQIITPSRRIATAAPVAAVSVCAASAIAPKIMSISNRPEATASRSMLKIAAASGFPGRLAGTSRGEAGFCPSGLESRPVFPKTSGQETQHLFQAPLPEEAMGAKAFKYLHDVVDHSRAQNGRFFGYVLGSGEPVGAIADQLASVLNQNVTAWRSAPAAVTLERTVVSWLAEAIEIGR